MASQMDVWSFQPPLGVCVCRLNIMRWETLSQSLSFSDVSTVHTCSRIYLESILYRSKASIPSSRTAVSFEFLPKQSNWFRAIDHHHQPILTYYLYVYKNVFITTAYVKHTVKNGQIMFYATARLRTRYCDVGNSLKALWWYPVLP